MGHGAQVSLWKALCETENGLFLIMYSFICEIIKSPGICEGIGHKVLSHTLACMGLLLSAWCFHTQGLIVWVLPNLVIDIWSCGWHFMETTVGSGGVLVYGHKAPRLQLNEHHRSQFQNNFHCPKKKPQDPLAVPSCFPQTPSSYPVLTYFFVSVDLLILHIS